MAWSWNGIEFTVGMAFGDAPLAASYTYTDVSAYVRGVPNVFRGKTSELDDLSPGYCTIILGNLDRRFDPDYTSGAYYPDVVPMVPVRLQATFSAVTYTVFTGFVLGWRQVEDATSGDLIVEAQCVDGTRFIRNNPLAGSAYEDVVLGASPIHYWPLQVDGQNLAGSTRFRIQADGLSVWDGRVPIGTSSGVTGDSDTESETKGARITETVRGVSFWVHTTSTEEWFVNALTATSTFAAASTLGIILVTYDNTADTREASITAPAIPLGTHHIALRATTSTVEMYVDGQLWTSATPTSSTSSAGLGTVANIGATTGAQVSHLALWTTAPSGTDFYDHFVAGHHAFGHPTGERGGARIGRVLDEIGWPAGRRDLDAGATRQAPYQPAGMEAIDYIRQVETGEQGMFFFDVDGNATFIDRIQLSLAASVATFSDDGAVGAIKYQSLQRDGSHVDTIANIVTTSYSDVGAITRRDATSIAAYDSSRKFIDAPTIPDGKTASNCSAYALRLGKDPASRIQSLTAPMRIDTGDNEADKLLALELGDKVVVERTPGGVGSQVVKTLIVQGIQHEIDLEQWMVTIYASPAPPAADDVPYFQVGDATYGKVGAAFGNAVIY